VRLLRSSSRRRTWTGADKGHAFFAYADNYLIDLKAAIIVDVEATRASWQAEVGAVRTMLDRTEGCFGLKPQRLSADSAYGSAEILDWLLEEKKVAPYGTRASAPTEPSVAPTSSSMLSRTPIPVQAVKFCSSITARSLGPGPESQTTTRGFTEPRNPTVRHVPSKPDAVPGS
jgi:hypothetical protein